MSSKPGMAYLVNITSRAERDLEHLYSEIDAAGSAAARKWYQGLKKEILSLKENPNRCPVTPEKRSNQAPAIRSKASRLPGDLPRLRSAQYGRSAAYPTRSPEEIQVIRSGMSAFIAASKSCSFEEANAIFSDVPSLPRDSSF